jgi:hypothetical protein
MAGIDAYLKQHVVGEFLAAEGERQACIHERLLRVYCEVTVGMNTVG